MCLNCDQQLQWGHDFSAVEMMWQMHHLYDLELALQWGHDFSAVEMCHDAIVAALRWHGFNGATTFQPWKSRFGP